MHNRTKRRWLVPEVIQTSDMDCGPASLKSLLAGYRIEVSYGRLREACQTEVDGTSIDTIEEVAQALGLDAVQKLLPVDSLFERNDTRLPAIVVTRTPGGLTHFLLAWRVVGGWVQVMDPATGRRWPRARQFSSQLFEHTMPAPTAEWLAWANTDDFLNLLRNSMLRVGVRGSDREYLIKQALEHPNPEAVGALDAAARLTKDLVESRAIQKGSEACTFLEPMWRRALSGEQNPVNVIPERYWFARSIPPDEDGNSQVLLRGVVLIEVHSRKRPAADLADDPQLSPMLREALEEPPLRPGRELLSMLHRDGWLSPAAILAALIPASFGVILQAVLLRAALELPSLLASPAQRLSAAAAFLVFLFALLLLEIPIASAVFRMGRHLELRFRVAFLRKVPRLADHYFHSRLTSDMADRSHNIHALREVASLGVGLVRSVLTLSFTAIGLIVLDPKGAVVVSVAATVSVLLPWVLQPLLVDRDLRVRTHAGAMTRFYLDGLLGLTAIRSHGAEKAVRTEHEGLLTEWARASFGLLRVSVAIDAVLALAGLGMAGALLLGHVARAGENSSVLLLAYWGLQLPSLGQQVAMHVRAYPHIRSVTLRLLEPLSAPEEEHHEQAADSQPADRSGEPGLAVLMQDVGVTERGQTILTDIGLDVPSGSHVAVVGHSGAGKSSLLGILLGWYRPTGKVLIDGKPLRKVGVDWLRQQTAWVDPAVQLWNRPFLANLLYGAPTQADSLSEALDLADLRSVLEKMPHGLQTSLGEGGASVSGGEGQRVRVGRALLKRNARLVLLDEAFRGLDRTQARDMLHRCRQWWSRATLVCVTHDMHLALDFPRVVVMREGQVVEDGDPKALAEVPTSEFGALLTSQEQVQSMWRAPHWRRVRVADGMLTETEAPR